jgi:hypothetical protein
MISFRQLHSPKTASVDNPTKPGFGKPPCMEFLPSFLDIHFLLHLAGSKPSHITELVGKDLGFTDVAQSSMGGMILLATR